MRHEEGRSGIDWTEVIRPGTAMGLVAVLISTGLAGCSAGGKPSLRIAKNDTTILISRTDASGQEEAPILRYRYAGMPLKPYVQEFYSPTGVNVLRDNVADHLHHHGLMLAVRVDDVDTWHEMQGAGAQANRGFSGTKAGHRDNLAGARFTQQLDWKLPGQSKVAMHERRTIEVHRGPDLRASLLTWRSALSLPEGVESATLSGAEYYGLGVRFVPSMDEVGRMFNADGETGVEGTNGARSNWCAYTAPAGGGPVTVAMFAHPKNPRHPATWFTMTTKFAYISATLGLKKEPFTIEHGPPVVLCYGFAVWDGEAGPAAVEALYQRWISLAASTSPQFDS